MPSWLQAAVDHAMNPIVNGIASAFIAVVAGLVIFALFRLVGQPLLNLVLLPLLRAVDHVLVRIIAPLTGIKFGRPVYRWMCFIGVFLALAGVAVFAPVFVAIGAVFAGIVTVLSIYRAWEQDELERQVAEDNGRDHQQENDYGNEILAGLLFLIVFFTLGFVRLGETTGDVPRLEEAIETYRGALEVHTRKAMPAAWATTLNNLGGVLETLGGMTGNTAHMQEAVDAFTSALEVRTREAMPADWAATRINLGFALTRLGGMTGNAQQIERAINGFEKILQVHTRQAMPVTWATTQAGLGTALVTLGGMTGDPARVRTGIEVLQTALEVRTRDATPENWADTQVGLGAALMTLGRLQNDSAHLEHAIRLWNETLEYYDDTGNTQTTEQINLLLQQAKNLLAQLKSG